VLVFPSLTTLRNRKNEIVTEHELLPTASMNTLMNAFVDSMDLSKAGEPDEDGCVLIPCKACRGA
jgi:hypothetical protein